ncbi:MAG: BACON domain-containing protein [Alistipes sp.]|nr:BACON domain-containing protein [Alistipes sp.]MBR5131607.1 BACON domain-containing protein [Alistipes sp.]
MKNLFKNLMLVAVAAMGFTACEQVIDDVNASNEKFTVNIVGEFADDTRSGFVGSETNDGKTFYKSAWDGSETAVFSLDEADLVSATNAYTDGGNKALFAPEFEKTGSTIYAFSPKYVANKCLGGISGINTKYRDVYVAIPSEQTPEAVSVDPAAHILAGEAEFAETVDMSFSHVLAYGKMTITHFDNDIKKVVITTDNKPLVGSSCYYYYADNTDGKSKGDLANVSECSLTINADNVVDNVFWFGCAPADLTGTTLKVKIYSGEDTYTRNVEISKTLNFQQGRVASFNISFAGIEKDVVTVDWVNNAYNLVKSAAHLEVGDQVVIAAAKSNYAMGASRGNNYAAIAVNKNDNGTIDFDSDVLVLTLQAGKKDGTYAFKYSDGYLYAASTSSNNLKAEKTLSDNSSFSVDIDENGVATIKAQGSNTRNWMRFNSTNNPLIFSCYGSGQADICIYKMVGEYTPKVPAIAYTVTNISIAHDATEGAATITATNGDGWSFSASTDADWVDELTYANSKISFVVDANETEEPRVATVTVTATKEGYDDVVTTFTITQGAKPGEGGDGPTYTLYEENFTTWTENGTSNSVNGTKEGNACTWSYVGASKQYWSNISSGSSLSFAISLLKPGSADATYVLSETLSGGIKNLKLTARSNNANTGVNIYVIDLATGATHKIATLNTTSKKADFTGEYDLSELNITGDYQIKIANKSTAAYCCIGGLSWNY